MARRVVLAILSLTCLLALPASYADQSQSKSVNSAPTGQPVKAVPQTILPHESFPVRFADTEIFDVATSQVSSLTPEDRASLILRNIQDFADSSARTEALRIVTLPEGLGIGLENRILLVISDRDAENSGMASSELADKVLARIRVAVDAYRTRHTWQIYGIGAAYSLLAIIALWLALHGIRWIFIWLTKWVLTLHDHWKGGIHFKQIELLSARRIEKLVLVILRVLRIFFILLCLYFFLPLILSFFPETRHLGSTILDYLIMPFVTIFHTLVKFIPNLFFIFVIGVIAFYVLKVISYVFGLIEHGELKFEWFYEDWARPTYQIIRFLVIVTALISAYPYIPGSSSQAFQGIGLVLGALISFASSSAIANIVAGVILTYTRAFKLNDRVKIGDTSGDVVDKTLLVTRIKTIKQEVVTVPNSLVMGSQIINYSTSAAKGDGVIIHTSVTIGYDVPWSEVKVLLTEAARTTKNILPEPEPFVLQTSLDDFYVSYEINAYTKEPKYMAFIYSDLHKNILEKFDAAGIEIMSPHYYSMRDGNASTVPSLLNAKGYEQPAFRIRQDPSESRG